MVIVTCRRFFIFIITIMISIALDSSDGLTFVQELTSPITTNARYPFLIGSSLTIFVNVYDDRKIVEATQKETTENRPLGKYSQYGDLMGQLVPNAAYFLLVGGYGLITSNKLAKTNASLMFAATFYAELVCTILKYTVREKRPTSDSRTSFPSGHTTAAFAFASVVGVRHNLFLGSIAYTIAGLVAYSRINDNQHWLHDVIAGATIGTSYGVGLSYLLPGNNRHSYIILPIPIKGGAMLSYSLKL
ncbi:MAG: phosphatase PAP2 family protein [Oligoflexia bacterium]|nr:phosphatase PAP2 family protein [Oligoflexia bacterium]